MHYGILTAAVLSAAVAAQPAAAQTVFTAPSSNNIVASSEVGMGSNPAHIFFVANQSTVPIIVFGFTLSECENVRQSCGGRNVHIPIPAGQRREVGRINSRDDSRAFSYRWGFSYHADSSDAQVLAVLREHGLDLQGRPTWTPTAPVVRTDTVRTVMLIPTPSTRRVITSVSADLPSDHPSEDAPASFHFKVFYGSILGSTMMPGAPIQKTGPCINPEATAKYEHDAKIARTPWRPAVPPTDLGSKALGILHDTTSFTGEALMRWAADTTGATIPESVSVLESTDGKVSVGLCKAVISTRVTPARDKAGKLIPAWVQLPITVKQFIR